MIFLLQPIINSIIWGNTPNEIFGTSVEITYSDVKGGFTGEGNIDFNPLFFGIEDYHLTANSPCINAGTPGGAPDHDIEGIPRPQGADYDMGAYEFVFKTMPWLHLLLLQTTITTTTTTVSTTTTTIPTTTTTVPTTTTTTPSGGSEVWICTEANCSTIRVTFGGVTPAAYLNCGTRMRFYNVPAGNYSYSAFGCGINWPGGSFYVNGTSSYTVWFCPPSGYPCCPSGCGTGGAYRCTQCY